MKLCLIIAFLSVLTSVNAKEPTWTCTKDGKAVEVKGEKAKDKQVACESIKGVWAEARDQFGKVKPVTVPVPASPRQDPGGGGSW